MMPNPDLQFIHKESSNSMTTAKYQSARLLPHWRQSSVLCRILEKLIRNQIVEYMQSENLLSDLQFGFIKGRSTSLQLLNIMNDWTCAIENSNSSDCIYLDYQKAFDTVPHKRLISKLYAYNIDEKIINWIKYYLSERKQ